MHHHELLSLIDELAPPGYAASWDNCGLQCGNPEDFTSGVMIAVNPSLAVAEAAEKSGANLLITHHPLLFKPTKRLDFRLEPGRTLQRLIRAGITCFAAHTNLDATACNHHLARLLELPLEKVLHLEGTVPWYRLGVMVPPDSAMELQAALWAAGAGSLGSYDRASFMIEGTGTFRPLLGSDPFEGTPWQLQRTPETRMEFLVPARVRHAVLAALHQTHPYEMPAYDLIQLANGGEAYGVGLWGELPEPLKVRELADRLRDKLGPRSLRLVGDSKREVTRVALCTGSGGDLLDAAARHGVDCFITGEMRYHTALEAMERGITVLEAGHQATEQPVIDLLVDYLCVRVGPGVPIAGFVEPEPFEVLV